MKDGKSILMDAYWAGKSGWKQGEVSPEDFLAARDAGFMFDYPPYQTHEESLKRIKTVVDSVDPADAANAFLFSLSTRKLEYRSALGSFYYAKAIPDHELLKSHNEKLAAIGNHCYFCDWQAWDQTPSDRERRNGLNVLNFERYKWGGVRHTKFNYALFDLEQFLLLPSVTPTEEDIDIFCKILDCVKTLSARDKVGTLRDRISKEKIFRTNKDEISILLDELGICGILASKQYPCFEERFVDVYARDPVEYKNDFSYPVNRWRAEDGINEERLRTVFGSAYELTNNR